MVRRQQFRQKIEGRNGGNTDVQQLLIFIGKFQNRFLLEIQDLGCVVVKGLPCGRDRGEIALTYVYGIGRSSSAKILDKAGVDRDVKVKDWTDDQAAKIREIIGAEYKVEGDLRSEVQLNIKRLMDIGCYRGVRHRIGLPVRGQSTKNNARTRKGRKKTVANKKKATK